MGQLHQVSTIMVDEDSSRDPNDRVLVVDGHNYVWDTGTLAWVRMTQPGGGGGGGGPVTVADGADVTQGAIADAAVGDAAGTVNSHLRQIAKLLAAPLHAIIDSSAALDISDRVGRLLGHVSLDTGGSLGIALDATLTGGTQKAIVRGGAKGATAAADVTSTAEGGDHQAVDVQIYSGGVVKDPTAIRALTAADVVTTAPPANASTNLAQVGAAAVSLGQKAAASSIPVVLDSDTDRGQKTMANSLPVALASDQSQLPAVAEIRAATLHVTGTAAVNTGVTVTLPAVAGQFHYITSIEVVKLYSVIGVAAGAGVIITSTDLPGNPAWTTEQLASAAGTAVRVIDYKPVTPLKSSVANTATTIVCPAQLQTIWRINVSYFTAP